MEREKKHEERSIEIFYKQLKGMVWQWGWGVRFSSTIRFPLRFRRFTKSFLKDMKLDLRNQRNLYFGILSRLLKFLD